MAYALSPIDLIPEFIPIVGYLDDLLIVPLGLALGFRLIPPDVLAEHRAEAEHLLSRPRASSWLGGAATMISIWAVGLAWLASIAWLLLRE